MKKVWKNKKYKKKHFVGYYQWFNGERVFELVHWSNGKMIRKTFESWQAAKALGWVKV